MAEVQTTGQQANTNAENSSSGSGLSALKEKLVQVKDKIVDLLPGHHSDKELNAQSKKPKEFEFRADRGSITLLSGTTASWGPVTSTTRTMLGKACTGTATRVQSHDSKTNPLPPFHHEEFPHDNPLNSTNTTNTTTAAGITAKAARPHDTVPQQLHIQQPPLGVGLRENSSNLSREAFYEESSPNANAPDSHK